MIFSILFLLGFLAWFIGSIAAGGSGIIFLVIAGYVLPLATLPVILAFVGTITGFYKLFLYYENIKFGIVKKLLVGTFVGILAGASLFSFFVSNNQMGFLKITLAVLLILNGFVLLIRSDNSVPRIDEGGFVFYSFVTGFFSSLIGAGSPLVNAVFQKTNLSPIEVVATKSCNNFILQLLKILAYAFLLDYSDFKMAIMPLSTSEFILVLVSILTGSMIGVFLGRKYIENLDSQRFSWIMNSFMISFGVYILITN